MTKVAENRVQLFEEVNDLRDKEKKQGDVMWAAKEGKRLGEARLEEANQAIKTSAEAWKTEHQTWEKEKADLAMEKTSVELAKADVEAKVTQI